MMELSVTNELSKQGLPVFGCNLKQDSILYLISLSGVTAYAAALGSKKGDFE